MITVANKYCGLPDSVADHSCGVRLHRRCVWKQKSRATTGTAPGKLFPVVHHEESGRGGTTRHQRALYKALCEWYLVRRAVHDLFIPILTFVFGEAMLGGNSAVVSTYRLQEGFYGLADDAEVLLWRLKKEAVHELGHTFGLVHCREFECVMHSSRGIEEVDVKSSEFCEDCTIALGRNLC